MLNITNQVLNPRIPVGFGFGVPRQLSARLRRNQPAASPEEAERGSVALSSTEVSRALAEAWGWS